MNPCASQDQVCLGTYRHVQVEPLEQPDRSTSSRRPLGSTGSLGPARTAALNGDAAHGRPPNVIALGDRRTRTSAAHDARERVQRGPLGRWTWRAEPMTALIWPRAETVLRGLRLRTRSVVRARPRPTVTDRCPTPPISATASGAPSRACSRRATGRRWPRSAPPSPRSTTPRPCPWLAEHAAATGGAIAGAAAGVGATEVPRRRLSDREALGDRRGPGPGAPGRGGRVRPPRSTRVRRAPASRGRGARRPPRRLTRSRGVSPTTWPGGTPPPPARTPACRRRTGRGAGPGPGRGRRPSSARRRRRSGRGATGRTPPRRTRRRR